MIDKIFCDGIFVKRNEKAPEFVIANLSFNVDKFTNFIKAQQNERGWVNIDLKKSKSDIMYAEVNTWKPQAKEQSFESQMNAPAQEPTKSNEENIIDIKDIPF